MTRMTFGQIRKEVEGNYYVIPRYNQYLAQRDASSVLKEYEALRAPMSRPERDRTKSWSASSCGRCEREQELTFLDFRKSPPGPGLNNIFANGDYVHLRHQAAGLVAGYITEVEVPVNCEELNLRGTMDGILDNGEGWEMKSINPKGYSELSQGPKEEHLNQVHAYMIATGIEAFRIVYENKAYQSLIEFHVPYDKARGDKVRDTLLKMQENMDTGRLTPMLPECKNKTGRYQQCQFASVCASAKHPAQKLLLRIKSSSEKG